MSATVSLITLSVADVAKATAFYERLGFAKSSASQEGEVTFFKAGAVALALWRRDEQIEDANADGLWTGTGGICIAQNVASEHAVDEMMAKAQAAGARVLKPGTKTFWGGYNGYFADPDGHLWEIAFNPFWPLRDDGRVDLPA